DHNHSMRSATILDKPTDSNLISNQTVTSNSDPFGVRYKEVYNYVTAIRLFSLLEAFIDRSRQLSAKERSEINAFVFSFGINSGEEKELDGDTFEQKAFRSAFALDAIINDWNEKYHITTENELNAQIEIQTAIEEAENKVKKAIAEKDSDKIKFALMQLSYATQRATEVKAQEKVKKSSNRKLSQVDVEVIRALYKDKLATLKMLADAYQMSETAINNAIKGITYRNEARKTRRISKADSLEIKRLRSEGMTYEAIAQRFDVSTTTVKYHLDKKS
ncbi:MAG: helix-turn-helix domain-containing protein, partial [Cyanobacteria bacterium P01_G01_bin.49]